MTITERLMDDLRTAMRAGDKQRVQCLRMLRARVQEREVELRGERGTGHVLDDDEALRMISAYAKQRRDSIAAFLAAGRNDLAERESAELAIVESYLPRQLSVEELREIVRVAIAESGATSSRDIGAVMKRVMPRVQGSADGKVVNRLVRESLPE